MKIDRGVLATQILTDKNFPVPFSIDEAGRTNTFLIPHGLGSSLNWIHGEHEVDGLILPLPHIKWIDASGQGQSVPESVLGDFAWKLKYEGVVAVLGITGRITSKPVLGLVEKVFEKQGWPTCVLLGTQAVELGCVADGPCSEEFATQVGENVEEGAPFVAFNPDFTDS